MSSEPLLTEEQEQSVVEAISRAEKVTSAEIRVHIEENCKKDPIERARKVFHKLKMDRTERKNGVLIYVATDDRKLAVFGGKGIYEKVGHQFWDDVVEQLSTRYVNGQYEKGLVEAVETVADKLEEIYPYEQGVVNELSNQISYQENIKKEDEG